MTSVREAHSLWTRQDPSLVDEEGATEPLSMSEFLERIPSAIAVGCQLGAKARLGR